MDVARQQGVRGQLIHRNIEKALNLTGMQIHRQHAARARHGQKVSDEARRDGHARLVLLVCPAIGIVRNDCRDALGRGPLQRVNHDQRFHDGSVHWRAERLDDEYIVAPDVLFDLDEGVLVRELEYLCAAGFDFQMPADVPRQLRVRVAREDC
jgi:hypothetical protein